MGGRLLDEVLAVILAGGEGSRLYPLTKDRAKPAVPFGGIYRIVDFSLNNCLNSNIRHIQVLSQYKSVSLANHLRDGWSFLHVELGEFITMLSPQMRISEDWYRGTADAVYQNIYSIEGYNPRYVLVLSGDHVYKMDYSRMLAFHEEKLADLTVAAIAVDRDKATSFGVLSVDEDDRITGFEEKPSDPTTIPYDPDKAYASMGVYIFDTQLMYSILAEDARADTSHDFGRDIIPAMAREYRIYAFPFGRDETVADRKYWRDVGAIDAYWEANMELCGVTPAFNLYDESWPLRTYQGQYPPAKTVFAYFDQNRAGMALNSLVCSGVIVSGGKVSCSVLSPRVHIHSYAEVDESVLLNGVDVGRRARIKRAIIDKYVRIPEGERIGFDLDRDSERFCVSEGGIVVIPKGTVL